MAKGKTATAASDAAQFQDSDATEGKSMIDLSSVDENSGGFEVLPRGMYGCIIDECSYGLSQSSGNPMWTWVLEVEDGEYAGRKLWYHMPFTEKMMGRIKKTLLRVAPELTEGPFDPEEVADQGTLIGKRLKARVDIRPYEGEKRNNVRDVLPADAPGEEQFL